MLKQDRMKNYYYTSFAVFSLLLSLSLLHAKSLENCGCVFASSFSVVTDYIFSMCGFYLSCVTIHCIICVFGSGMKKNRAELRCRLR